MNENEPISPKEFAKLMTKIKGYDISDHRTPAIRIDMEMRHIQADNLLCETLRHLGYGDGVDIYHQIQKWYS